MIAMTAQAILHRIFEQIGSQRIPMTARAISPGLFRLISLRKISLGNICLGEISFATLGQIYIAYFFTTIYSKLSACLHGKGPRAAGAHF